MKHIDIPPPLSNQAIPFLTASGGRRMYRQTKRECTSLCAFSVGCVLILMFGMLVLIFGPSIYPPFFIFTDTMMAIIGIVLFIGGSIVFTSTIRERRRVMLAVKDRDGVNLDMISSEARVPYKRTKEYLTNLIAIGLLKGGIVDDTYVASMKAERIDSRTVRCPHCDTLIELPEDV